jgi:hypothetical protein
VDVVDGTLAKHGYTVEGGYFSGTCHGSHSKPLQVERTLTDSTVKGLRKAAVRADAMIVELQAGRAHPDTVAHYLDEYRTVRDNRFQAVQIDWADANEISRIKGVAARIANLEGQARFFRSHAQDMLALAAKLHGTKLIDAQVIERAKSERQGTRAAASARKEQLYVLGKAFEKGYDAEIRKVVLAARPADGRMTDEQMDVYYGCHYPHEWTAKRRANVLAVLPQATATVAKLDAIVAEHAAMKAAVKAAKESK